MKINSQKFYHSDTELEINKPIFSVSELNYLSKEILESTFPNIIVEGEMSNLAQPRSGHLYFSLKDEVAQIRCAMFKHAQRDLDFLPENGQSVQASAKVSIYPDRGDYQLIVSRLAICGDGQLRAAYDKLLKKLHYEGLTHEDHKKSLPAIPLHLGIISSPTGAAIQDVISVLKRRAPWLPITIYPTPVQGKEAKQAICQALLLAQQHKQCDVIILTRGGGSLEDLWPFNEETVARAVFDCTIPIICGVGHEIDTTICDYIADKRAPTPSAAAELVVPSSAQILQQIEQANHRLIQKMRSTLDYYIQKIDHLRRQLKSPSEVLAMQSAHIQHLKQQITLTTQHYLKTKIMMLGTLQAKLHTLSPQATLERGYAIATITETQTILTNSQDIQNGSRLTIQLSKGCVESIVDKITT